MGGRGRGRGGRGRGMSFTVEQLGFKKGEALPQSILQPPPLYPPLDYKPVPLDSGLDQEYLLVVMKQFRLRMRDSPCYVQPHLQRKDIDRYTDKYQIHSERTTKLNVDWSRFPSELKPAKKRKAKPVKPNLKVARTLKAIDVSKHFENLEKAEKDDSEVEAEEEEEKEEEQEEVEEDQDEEMDEETDYVNSYFDNGESYLDEEEDNIDDGPVY